jgi:hypothetical protein
MAQRFFELTRFDMFFIDVEGVTLVLPSRLFMLNKYWRILALSKNTNFVRQEAYTRARVKLKKGLSFPPPFLQLSIKSF